MIDETKLKKLLADIVTDLSYTVMPSYHTDRLFEGIKDKIERADLNEEGADSPATDSSTSDND